MSAETGRKLSTFIGGLPVHLLGAWRGDVARSLFPDTGRFSCTRGAEIKESPGSDELLPRDEVVGVWHTFLRSM